MALVGAFVTTMLVSSPLIAFPFYAGDAYKGLNIAHFGTDEHIYLTRAKEVLEDHQLGQPVLSANKDLQDPTFSYVERVVLSPLTLSGLAPYVDVVTIYNIYNFIGVFVLLIILYAIALALTADTWLATAAAMSVIGGYSIVYNKTLFFSDFNIYGRSDFPYMASIPFFLMCLFLIRARELQSYRYALAAAAAFGFLFYDYFYGWTFALALLGSFALMLLLFREYKAVLQVIISGIVGLCIAIPVLYLYVLFFTSSAGSQLSYFLLSVPGRKPVMSAISLLLLLLIGVFWYIRRDRTYIPFYLAIVLASWIAVNEQLVTGRFIQYGHYYWYFIVPSCILVSVCMVGLLAPKKWRMAFTLVLLGVILLNTTVGQYRSFFTTLSEKMRDQDFAPFITLLNRLPQGAVVTEDLCSSFPMLITIYTNHDLFYGGSAQTYNVSLDYMKDVLLTHLFLNKDARRDPIQFLRKNLDTIHHDEYTSQYHEIEGYYSGTDYYTYHDEILVGTTTVAVVRAKLLAELSERQRMHFAGASHVRDFLVRNGVRYILADYRITPEWDVTALAPITLLASSSDIALYELSGNGKNAQ